MYNINVVDMTQIYARIVAVLEIENKYQNGTIPVTLGTQFIRDNM